MAIGYSTETAVSDPESVSVIGPQKHIVRRYLGDSWAPMREVTDEDDDTHDALNTRVLQEIVAVSGKGWLMRPGSFFRLSQRAEITVDETCIEGQGSSRGTLYMPASAFSSVNATNTTGYGVGQRYGSNAVGLMLTGQRSGSYLPISKAAISNIHLRSEVDDGRMIVGIAAHNCEDCDIDGNELSGFPLGDQINLQSFVGGSVSNNYIHDCLENSTAYAATPAPNITAIHIDGDPINSVRCQSIKLHDNRIISVRVGLDFRLSRSASAPWLQEQSDGINVAHYGATDLSLRGNYIEDTGEGIDCFGSDSIISGNRLVNNYIYGLKFIHGAQNNLATGNRIRGSGLAGIIVTGSSTAGRATENIVVTSNEISDIDPDLVWAVATTSCISVTDGGTFVPNGCFIALNKCLVGNATVAILRSSTGTNVYSKNDMELGYSGNDYGGAEVGVVERIGGLPVSNNVFTVSFGGALVGATVNVSGRVMVDEHIVEFFMAAAFTNKGSSTGNFLISGLPVASMVGLNFPCTIHASLMTAGVGDTMLSALVMSNTTTIEVYKMAAGVGNPARLTDADFTNTSLLRVSGRYLKVGTA